MPERFEVVHCCHEVEFKSGRAAQGADLRGGGGWEP